MKNLFPAFVLLFATIFVNGQTNRIQLDSINSSYDEKNPVLSPDGQRLYFVRSGHPQNEGGVIDMGDIWYAEKDSAGYWRRPVHAATINHKGLNGIAGFSASGNRIYLLNYEDNGGNLRNGIAMAEWVRDHWSVPQRLSIRFFTNKGPYLSASISPDEKVMILSMTGLDTYGNEDLYVTFKQSSGEWSQPQNLGKAINTEGEEWSPFLSADMNTLYFSSNGHGGFGSRDIFMSQRQNGSWTNWSKPVNLGDAINTKGVELGYSIPSQGEMAYYSSTQNSEGFGDIFGFPLSETERAIQELMVKSEPEKKENILPNVPERPVVAMTMQVLDITNDRPIDAFVKLSYGEKVMEVNTANADSPEGKFLVTLEEGVDVYVEIEAEGYFKYKEKFVANATPLSGDAEFGSVEGFRLTPREVGTKITIENILFDQGNAKFSNPVATAKQLDHLVALMQTNPDLEIRLEGHTDNRGNPKLLKDLSLQRVGAVKAYLIEKGIASKRIATVGYGGENPIASNSTNGGRELNRRVEFVIVK